MLEKTLRSSLPLIMHNQAQKHVTHNESLCLLDTLTSLHILKMNVLVPPESPVASDTYTVGDNPTGEWQGHTGEIAIFSGDIWKFTHPFIGLRAYNVEDEAFLYFDGNEWLNIMREAGAFDSVNVSMAGLGINANSDDNNKLVVKSEFILFSANDADQNVDGDVHLIINKTSINDTASLIFQNNYAGKVELGLNGDDNFSIKTSNNGANFSTSFEINNQTGYVGIGTRPTNILDVKETHEGGLAQVQVFNPSVSAGSGSVFSVVGGNGHKTQLLQYASGASYLVSNSSTLYVQITGAAPQILFLVGDTEGIRLDSNKVTASLPLKLPVYLKKNLPSARTIGKGGQVYVDNAIGGSIIAFSDGKNWRRCTDRTVIS